MRKRSNRSGTEADGDGLTDCQLLEQFVDHEDDDAFAELVARHAALVLGVCRRTLGDEHCAEDAFQAVFLVLARRASQIRKRSSLAGWLYAVAYRTAQRSKAKRRGRREQALRDEMPDTDDLLAGISSRYEQQLLDEELHRLGEKYREPLVLRYLMGKSNRQVAAALGLTLGVVEGRLKQGKDRLRLRLAKRGISTVVALTTAGAATGVLQAADSLIATTVARATAFRAGTEPLGHESQDAIRLAEQELAMKTSTLAITSSGAAVALITVGLTLAWASDVGQQPAQAGAGVPPIAVTASAPAEETTARFGLAKTLETELDPPGSRRAANERIEKVLREPTTLELIDVSLSDAAEAIAKMHQIHVLIDSSALEEDGLDPAVPVDFNLPGVSLHSGLNHMLRPLQLTWTIRDEVLVITTQVAAETMLTTKIYEVADLVTCQDKSGAFWADYDALIEVITTSIDPDTWDEVGGNGSMAAAPFAGAEMLAVSQTYQVHEEIEQLLEQMRAIAKKTGIGKTSVREQPSGPAMIGGMGGMMPAQAEGETGDANPE